VTFHEATHLSADDVLRLQRTLQRRVLRLFQRLARGALVLRPNYRGSAGYGERFRRPP
jgi:dipeptidyl aminopeptidase/acylaminoacyl peptidase